ncbi:helix-turn-helix domain-containing protein [Pseudomonadota bacterium]
MPEYRLSRDADTDLAGIADYTNEQSLGRSLKEKRQRKCLSHVALARLVNSSQSRVAKMETGDATVSAPTHVVQCHLADQLSWFDRYSGPARSRLPSPK